MPFAEELRPEGGARAEELASVVSHLFREAPKASLKERPSVLEAQQAGIADQLAVIDDAAVTGTGRSSAELLGVPGAALAERLTAHLVREIMDRGSGGGPLEPLAAQLNHDLTHRQGRKLESMPGQLATEVRVLVCPGAVCRWRCRPTRAIRTSRRAHFVTRAAAKRGGCLSSLVILTLTWSVPVAR